MNSTELRIGNLIYLDQLDDTITGIVKKPVLVTHILIRDCVVNGENWTGSPIPLTAEWLERFGFEGNLEDGYGKDIVELNHLTTEEYFEFEYKPGAAKKLQSWFVVPVKYVHTLQNLYFALVGEELSIN